MTKIEIFIGGADTLLENKYYQIMNLPPLWQFYRWIELLLFLLIPINLLGAGIAPPSPSEEGKVLLQARTYHLAIEKFLMVQDKSENPLEQAQALKLIGDAKFYEKDYTSSVQAYQKALRLYPLATGALGLEFKSAVSLIFLKKYDSALDTLKELENRSTDPDTLSDPFLGGRV